MVAPFRATFSTAAASLSLNEGTLSPTAQRGDGDRNLVRETIFEKGRTVFVLNKVTGEKSGLVEHLRKKFKLGVIIARIRETIIVSKRFRDAREITLASNIVGVIAEKITGSRNYLPRLLT